MAARVVAIIPARLGSRRFSRKVLYPFHGKPLLFYVWDQLRRCRQIDRLAVATDSAEIESRMDKYGIEVIRTASSFKTGSDRVAAVCENIKGDIILNVQADCFGLNPTVIDRTIAQFTLDRKSEFGTLAKKIESDEELFDPNCVKLVTDSENNALWFSRFPIPFVQNASDEPRCRQFKFLKHIGVYFFRRSGLKKFAGWKQHQLEKAESLEQLRVLTNGSKMRVYATNMKTVSIENLQDLKKIDRL